MNWNDVRLSQIPRLEALVALLDHGARLCQMAPADAPREVAAEIQTLLLKAQSQLDRLRRNRFEIAILGLEKSGKSTLLNAWLGAELLPAAPERCTYTKTEVWAASSEEDQRLLIEYYTADEFDQSVRAKREALALLGPGKDHDELAAELDEVDKLRSDIAKWTARGSDAYTFREISEIREPLENAVARDRARARAAKRIELRTSRLNSERDVVFFDVPGFNSPVTLHRQQAEDALRAVDVMIYAKEASKPDTEVSERRMLDVADREDPLVRVADKTFVALTRIDSAGTVDELNDWIEKSRSRWPGVPIDRIIPVCPPARLAAMGTGRVETNARGERYRARLRELGCDDGLEQLRSAVERYIDRERAQVLERRCGAIYAEGQRVTEALVDAFGRKLPDDLGRLEEAVEEAGNRDFAAWWAAEWRRVEAEYAKFYDERIRGKESVDGAAKVHPRLEQLRAEFERQVDERFNGLELLDPQRIEAVYRRWVIGPGGAHQPGHAHEAVRRELHPQAMSAIDEISIGLADALHEILRSMVDEAVRVLWGVEAVRRELIGDEKATRMRIEHGISTLFLRFARVAVNLLISVPRSQRPQLVNAERSDLLMLAQFDSRLEPGWADRADRTLDLLVFAAEKMKLLPPGSAEVVAGIKSAVPGPKARRDPFGSDGAPKGVSELGGVVTEVQTDVAALRDLLKLAVFDAAGFAAYCAQEADRLRLRFLDAENRERRWHHVVQTEVRRKNPRVPFRLDDREDELRRKRELGLILSEVRDARSRFIARVK